MGLGVREVGSLTIHPQGEPREEASPTPLTGEDEAVTLLAPQVWNKLPPPSEEWAIFLASKAPKTYIFRASWRATAKTIKLNATSEEKAFQKALRRKDTRGCTDLTLLEVRAAILPPLANPPERR